MTAKHILTATAVVVTALLLAQTGRCDVPIVSTDTQTLSAVHTMPAVKTCATTQPIAELPMETKAESVIVSETENESISEEEGIKAGDVIECRFSSFCSCSECCGKSDGITASGRPAHAGTVACNWLPLGSTFTWNGTTYTVDDRGSSYRFDKVGRIDVWMPTHEEAIQFGIQYGKITIESVG